MALLERLLDKGRGEDVAAHIDVLADVEPRKRGADAELDGLDGFSG